MNLDHEIKSQLITSYRRSESDTGTPEVQVALLSEKIRQLTEHLKLHRKDHASRRGLRVMVGKRRRLLRYLQGQSNERYQQLIGSLGLRK
jgi:small subunit ribosomal protein S15